MHVSVAQHKVHVSHASAPPQDVMRSNIRCLTFKTYSFYTEILKFIKTSIHYASISTRFSFLYHPTPIIKIKYLYLMWNSSFARLTHLKCFQKVKRSNHMALRWRNWKGRRAIKYFFSLKSMTKGGSESNNSDKGKIHFLLGMQNSFSFYVSWKGTQIFLSALTFWDFLILFFIELYRMRKWDLNRLFAFVTIFHPKNKIYKFSPSSRRFSIS